MAIYSNEDIERLISCPKVMSVPPARTMKLIGGDFRNKATMVATDGTKGTFTMFIRRLEDFPENFSVGLMYHPGDGAPDIILLRMNGKHGEFTGQGDPQHPHYDFHIHKATERAQNEGFRAEKYAASTSEFASMEQAVEHYVNVVVLNQQDARKHFSRETQASIEYPN